MTPQNHKNPTNLVETSPVTKACDAIGRAFDPRDASLQEGAEPPVGHLLVTLVMVVV